MRNPLGLRSLLGDMPLWMKVLMVIQLTFYIVLVIGAAHLIKHPEIIGAWWAQLVSGADQ